MESNIPKPPKVVVAPEGCMSWFTAGKAYPVVEIWDGWDHIYGYGFKIADDSGTVLNAVEKDSLHAGVQDWIIKEREA